MKKRTDSNIRFLCRTSLIAALYVLLTSISAAVGLSSGPVQLRLSEALCFFAVFTPAAVPGVALGCFVSNILTACPLWDIVLGTLASLIGMIGCRALRKFPYLAAALYALANIVAIPLLQAYVYSVEEALPLLFLFAAVGELLAVYGAGVPIYLTLKKHENLIFTEKNRPH